MDRKIALIRGDGIGPEIVASGREVSWTRLRRSTATAFHYADVDMGGCAIDKCGDPLPQENAATSALLLTAFFWALWAAPSGTMCPGTKRPEEGPAAAPRRYGRLQQQPPRQDLASAGFGLAAKA